VWISILGVVFVVGDKNVVFFEKNSLNQVEI
jgi:hypothetical protein